MKFLSRLDDFEHIVIDGSVSGTGLSSLYLKDTATPILRIGNNSGDSFITYDGSELSISSDVDLRLTTPTDQDVFLITSTGNIITTQAGGTFTIGGGLTLPAITGGFLKTDASGNVSVDSSAYLTSYTETQTLDDVTTLGATTTNNITVGDITAQGGTFTQAGGGVKILNNGTSGYNANIFFGKSDGTDGYTIGQGVTANDGVFRIYNNGTVSVPLAIADNNDATFAGNVGIGTTNSTATLTVVGNQLFDGTGINLKRTGVLSGRTWNFGVDSKGLSIYDVTSSAYRLTIDSSGNVGIGTADPSSDLDVVGNTRLGPDSEHAFQVTDDSTNNFLVLSSTQRTTSSAARDIKFRSYGTDATDNVLVMDMSAGNVGIGTDSPSQKLDVNGTAYFRASVGVNGEGNGITVDSGFGVNGRVGLMKYQGLEGMLVAGSGTKLRLGRRTDSTTVATSGTPTIAIDIQVNTDGTIIFPQYGAGILKTNAFGAISLDTSTYLTSVAFSDLTSTPTTIAGYGITDALEIGTTATTALAGNTSIPVSGTDFDPVGTDNSTDVTLAGSYDYLTLSGQEITLGQIDYDTDITNTPTLGTAASSAATDFVAVTGDTMTGQLVVDYEGYQIKLIDGSSDNTAEFVASNNSLAFFSDRSNSTADSDIFFSIDNDTKMLIDTNGNVGIGTTNPETPLHVMGDVGAGTGYNGGYYASSDASNVDQNWGFDFSRTSGVNDYSVRVKFYPDSGSSRKLGFYDSRNNTWLSYFNGSVDSNPNFIINSGGNVGIGNTAPSNTFTVGANLTYSSTFNHDSLIENLMVRGSGSAPANLWLHKDDQTILDTNDLGSIKFSGHNGTDSVNGGRIWYEATEDWSGSTNSTRFSVSVVDGTTSTTGLVIESDGAIQLPQYTAGILTSDASGNVTVDTSTYLTSFTEADTLDSVTGRGATTTNSISVGAITATSSSNTLNLYNNANNDAFRVFRGSLQTLSLWTATNGTILALSSDTVAESITLDSRANQKSYINTGGNFGIGTDSPQKPLHIQSANDAPVRVESTDATTGILFVDPDGSNALYYVGSGDYFYTSSKLGIGTTSTDAHLHVKASSDAHLLIESDNTMSFYQDAGWSSTMMFGAKWNGTNQVYGATTRGAFKMVALHDADNSPQYLAIYGANHGTAGGTVTWNTVGFAQDEDGKVGIGTTNPTTKLYVDGGESTFNRGNSDGAIARFRGKNNEKAVIGTLESWFSGEVGIGTTNPTAKLDVFSSTDNIRLIRISHPTAPTNASGFLGFNTDGTTDNAVVTIGVQYSATYYDVINIKRETQNVGIGTTNPAYTLDVKKDVDTWLAGVHNTGSDANAQALLVRSDATAAHDAAVLGVYADGGYKMMVRSTGNVGIGTTSPDEKLHVVGAIKTSRTTAASENTFIYNQQTAKWGSSTYPGIIESVGNNSFLIGSSQNIPLHLVRNGAIALTIGSDNDVIVPNGDVGIGTTSPTYKLNVVTNAVAGKQNLAAIDRTAQNFITFTNPQYSADSSVGLLLRVFPQSDARQGAGIIASGGSNNATTDLDLFVTTSPDGLGGTSYSALKINGLNGNVGIGTDSPDAKLDVEEANNPTIRLTNSSDPLGAADVGTLEFFTKDSSAGASRVLSSIVCVNKADSPSVPDGQLVFKTSLGGAGAVDATEKMRITAGGNVGIGTTNPSEKLEVDGNVQIGSSVDAKLYMVSSGGNGYNERFFIEGYADGGTYGGGFKLSTRNDSNIFNTAVTVNRNGNVGIGTTDPGAKLEVETSGTNSVIITDNSDTQYSLIQHNALGAVKGFTGYNSGFMIYGGESGVTTRLQAGGAYAATILTNGNFGIGTTSPGTKLDVHVGGTGIRHYSDVNNKLSTYVGSGYQILEATYSGATNEVGYFNGEFYVQTSDTDRMRIDASGNVGIGTTTPATKLHVVGTAETRLRVGSSNASSNVVLELRDENTPTGQGTVITYNNATGETYFNNALSTATTDFHFQSGEYGTANDFFTLSNSGGNSILHLKTTSGDSFITYEDSTNELAVASDGDLRLTTPTDQDVFFISSGGNIETTQAGGSVSMGGDLVVDGDITGNGNAYITGNVGIGTTSPASKLVVADGMDGVLSQTAIEFIPQDANNRNIIFSYDRSSSAYKQLNFDASDFSFNPGGSAEVVIKSSGNVGIGITSPYTKLVVGSRGTAAATSILAYDGIAFDFYNDGSPFKRHGVIISQAADASESVLDFNTKAASGTNSTKMTILGNGNVGIGTNNPSYKLTVSSGTDDIGILTASSDSGAYVGFLDNATSVIPKVGAVGNKLILDASQYVGVRRTDPSYALDVNGTIRATGDVIAYSDARVKENVETIPNALDKVKAMRGVGYNKIGEEKRSIGVIAQEMLEVMPEAVHQDEQGMYSVAYGNLVGVLIEAVKDLESKVEQLQNKIDGIAK